MSLAWALVSTRLHTSLPTRRARQHGNPSRHMEPATSTHGSRALHRIGGVNERLDSPLGRALQHTVAQV